MSFRVGDAFGVPRVPADLTKHAVVSAATVTPTVDWRFSAGTVVRVCPRLSVNSVEAAIAAAQRGQGLTRVLSYQVAEAVAAGTLQIVLEEHEPDPLPVHLIHAEGRAASAKLRAFMDEASASLRARLAHSGGAR